MKYYLCKRCGMVFSEKEIEAADWKCPACYADFKEGEDVFVPCDKDGKLIEK